MQQVAHVGNSSVIAAVGVDGSLWFYWQTIGTAQWHAEQVSGPNSILQIYPHVVSVAQVGNSSVSAAVRPDASLWFYWQTIGTAPWHAEQVAGPSTTVWPSVAQVGNSSVIAATTTNEDIDNGRPPLWFYWQTIGAAQWHAENVGANLLLLRPVSVAQVGNSSVIVALGDDDTLWFYWQTIGTAQWHAEQVTGASFPNGFLWASVAQVGNSSVIAAEGDNHTLWFFWQTIGTAEWHAEKVAPGNATLQSVAQVGNSSVIATQGGDTSLRFYWQTIGTAPWHAEQVTPPGAGRTPVGVAQVGNSSVIAAVGFDGSLWFYWQTIGTAPWHAEQVAPPGSLIAQ
jgi:hypothetical protein